MPISDLVARVAQVRCLKEGNQLATGSCFFYAQADGLYLITNRHVIIKEEDKYFPDEIKLRLHTNPNDIRQNEDLSLPLYDHAGKPVWLEHPTGGKKIDVVAISIDSELIESRFFVRTFSTADLIPKDVEISIGEDILVLAYPMGFHDVVHNLPLVRNAIMASVYPVPFNGDPLILIDSRLHRGTSGSPVLTKPTQMIRRADGSTSFLGGPVTFLVGVHSAAVDIVSRDPERDEPLGLNVVWFASLIPEIITKGSA